MKSSPSVTKTLILLQWRHKERDGVSNHCRLDGLLNRLFRRTSKKTSKLRVTDFCEGNSTVTGEFPSQRASNAKNVSIWWRHDILPTALLTPWFLLQAAHPPGPSWCYCRLCPPWCPARSYPVSQTRQGSSCCARTTERRHANVRQQGKLPSFDDLGARSGYIPWDVITYPCRRCVLLVPNSSIVSL